MVGILETWEEEVEGRHKTLELVWSEKEVESNGKGDNMILWEDGVAERDRQENTCPSYVHKGLYINA